MNDKKAERIDADDSLKPILLEVERSLVRACLEKLKDDPSKLRGSIIKEIRELLQSYGVLKVVDRESTPEGQAEAELDKLMKSLPEFDFEFDETLQGNQEEEEQEGRVKSWDGLPLR